MAVHIKETKDGCKVTFNDMTGKASAFFRGKKTEWVRSNFKHKTYQVLLKQILDSLINPAGEL